MADFEQRRINFNDLPNEIIDNVLTLLMNTRSSHRFHAFVALRQALSLICKLWNVLVFGKAVLWQRIEVYCYSNMQYVQQQISRAKELPLTVTLDLCPDPSPLPYDVATLDNVVPRFEPKRRVVNLTPQQLRTKMTPIFADIFQRIGSLQVVAEDSSSLLETLAELTGYDGAVLTRTTFRLLQHRPSDQAMFMPFQRWNAVSDLALKCVLPLDSASHAIYANLSALRLFHVPKTAGVLWEDFADALRSINRLKLLQLENFECDEVEYGQQLTLPFLTHLIFAYASIDAILLVSSLDLPNIDSFLLSDYRGSVGPFVDYCFTLLRRVTVVEASLYKTDTQAAQRMLEMLGNVERLNLRGDSEVVVSFLENNEVSLPCLELITFFELDATAARAILGKVVPPRFPDDCRVAGGLFVDREDTSHDAVEWKLDDDGGVSFIPFEGWVGRHAGANPAPVPTPYSLRRMYY
ncbi:hypothetical protein C8R44DRAFT_871994 [Mycena epipterygia]|nr:hypothetical protein C8R44DRAFT_871994 [Mycena epipterygia]